VCKIRITTFSNLLYFLSMLELKLRKGNQYLRLVSDYKLTGSGSSECIVLANFDIDVWIILLGFLQQLH